MESPALENGIEYKNQAGNRAGTVTLERFKLVATNGKQLPTMLTICPDFHILFAKGIAIKQNCNKNSEAILRTMHILILYHV